MPRISQPVASDTVFRRTSGVLPTRSTKPLRTSMLRLDDRFARNARSVSAPAARGKPGRVPMPETGLRRCWPSSKVAALGARDRADRHPRRDHLARRRARLQAEAPGPLQLPRLHHARATRGRAAPRARAQPAHRPAALSPGAAGDRASPMALALDGAGRAGRVAAGDAPLPGRGSARPRRGAGGLAAPSWSTRSPRRWRPPTPQRRRAATGAGSRPCARSPRGNCERPASGGARACSRQPMSTALGRRPPRPASPRPPTCWSAAAPQAASATATATCTWPTSCCWTVGPCCSTASSSTTRSPASTCSTTWRSWSWT